MIYLFRRQASEGATELAEALNDANIPTRRTQGGILREQRVIDRLAAGRDRLISWGDFYAGSAPTSLNNTPSQTKLRDAEVLRGARIRTVETAITRPANVPAERPAFQLAAGTLSPGDCQSLIRRLSEHLAAPLPEPTRWLGRRNNHVGGSDLLRPPTSPDYWSRYEPIREEYRIHSFRGKSIRAGHKIPREVAPNGQPTHPWIRSFDAGWIIAYDNFSSTREMKDLAAGAVQALGLSFGAVDIARLADNSLMVLEVNRAPGVEGGSVDAYVGAIRRWVAGEAE